MDSDKWTDEALDRLEKRISEAYEEASKELGEKAKEYFLEYDERFKKEELAMLTSSLPKEEIEDRWLKLYGNTTRFENWFLTADHAYGATPEQAEQQFKAWEYAQLGRGQHWYDMRDQMAERLTETNKIAEGYINDVLPKVYITNSNGVAEIAKESAMAEGKTGIRFDLADEYTVRKLMMESSDVRPYKPVNISIDESTRWSKNKLQNALLQGILQGDSIDHIADRFQTVTNMNRASAIRNARTATTGAQSAGKQDRYDDLAKQGCIFSKIWVATEDERTREEHAEADGQEVDYDLPFDVGGEELMYPADPKGSGWNIYNCRCTMKTGKPRFTSILSDQGKEDEVVPSGIYSDKDLSQITGANVDFSKMDEKVAQDYREGIAKMYEEYPALKGFVSEIGTNAGFGASGETSVVWEGKGSNFIVNMEMQFHAYKSFDEYVDDVAYNIEKGFKFAGQDGKVTAIHEGAHALERLIFYTEKGLYNPDTGFVPQSAFTNMKKCMKIVFRVMPTRLSEAH